MAAGFQVEEVFATTSDAEGGHVPTDLGTSVYTVSDDVLKRLAGTEHPRGPISVVGIPEPMPPMVADSIVLVDVADPGNVGTIIRSAAAFGFQVIVAPGCADPWSPKALRSAAGGHFHTRIAPVVEESIAAIHNLGLTSAALVVGEGEPLRTIPSAGPLALVVGSEPHGLPESLVAECRHRITLPMPGGTESLNAAVAASIAMYEWTQRP